MALTFKDAELDAVGLKEMPVHNMVLKEFKIKDLTLSPLNPTQRTSKHNMRGLMKNLFEIGHIEPITVVKKNKKNMVVNGHRRFTALKQLGRKTVQTCVIESTIDYDKLFTALHEDTLKISAVQECERWLKGATEISKRVMRSIKFLESKLGPGRTKQTITRCVAQNISAITLADGMSLYLKYTNLTSKKAAIDIAYYILNVSTAFKVRTAIHQFIPIITLVDCVIEKKPLPDVNWE